MDAQKLKAKRGLRRKRRVRKSIRGTAAKPRLSVFRSNFHIYAQLIDDDAQVTLAAASTNEKGTAVAKGGNVTAALAVGKALAARATAKGITEAAFDRGPFRFHGRVAAVARGATDAGLKCTGPAAAPKEPKESKDAGKSPADVKKDSGPKKEKKAKSEATA